jgi:hypothetical protein
VELVRLHFTPYGKLTALSVKYIEISALKDTTGVKGLFDEAIRAVLSQPRTKKHKSGLLKSLWNHTIGGLFRSKRH